MEHGYVVRRGSLGLVDYRSGPVWTNVVPPTLFASLSVAERVQDLYGGEIVDYWH